MKDKREVMMMTMITSNQGQGVDGEIKEERRKTPATSLRTPSVPIIIDMTTHFIYDDNNKKACIEMEEE